MASTPLGRSWEQASTTGRTHVRNERGGERPTEALLAHRAAGPPGWSVRFIPFAYRVKTRFDLVLAERARRRGWSTTAIGYPGYAARGRARAADDCGSPPPVPIRTPVATSPAGAGC